MLGGNFVAVRTFLKCLKWYFIKVYWPQSSAMPCIGLHHTALKTFSQHTPLQNSGVNCPHMEQVFFLTLSWDYACFFTHFLPRSKLQWLRIPQLESLALHLTLPLWRQAHESQYSCCVLHNIKRNKTTMADEVPIHSYFCTIQTICRKCAGKQR